MGDLENRRKDKKVVCDPIQTNLSISITGPDNFSEGANTIYNMILNMTGLIGAENVLAVVTLPAGISYVGSVDGSNVGQTVTWTIAELIGNYTRQFTISGATAGNYTLSAVLTTDTENIGTETATKPIEVVVSGGGPIVGCMDDESINYNPNATVHDWTMCNY